MDEKLIDYIEQSIMDGKHINSISNDLELNRYYIYKEIKALDKPETIDRYNKIKDQIKINSRKGRNPIIAPEEYGNYIDDIERCIFEGHLYKETAKLINISRNYVNLIIEDLNNSNSSIYDEERYKAIKEQHNKLMALKFAEGGKRGKNNYLKKAVVLPYEKYIDLIVSGKMSILEAVKLSNAKTLDLIIYLINIKDSEIQEKLYPILNEFDVFLNFNNGKNKPLKNKSLKVRQEIILVALTYRVSFKSLAKMFRTSVLDIIESFRNCGYYIYSLDKLFLETLHKDENYEKLAFANAVKYFNERKRLLELIEYYKIQKDQEKVKELRMELKNLRELVDDTIVERTIYKNVNDLSNVEKDLIAKYPLKYFVSLKEAGRILKRDYLLIAKYIEDLSERNIIFKEKMQIHDAKFQELHANYRYPTHFDNNSPKR